MVKKACLILLLAVGLYADSLLERVSLLMDPSDYDSHKKLIALLFEDETAFRAGPDYDMVKIATVLEENGLLRLSLGENEEIGLIFEYEGENPLFFMKLIADTLRSLGLSSVLTKRASFDENGFVWRVGFVSSSVPDPVLIAERLKKRDAKVTDIERVDAALWRYRVDLNEADMSALSMEAGDVRKIVRPVRPVWIDVSHIRKLTIRELPGSHWHADVVVYDKMLHILSMRQNDTRTRFMRLRLPGDAAYVKISDRFTLENLRSGLKLNAQGAR